MIKTNIYDFQAEHTLEGEEAVLKQMRANGTSRVACTHVTLRPGKSLELGHLEGVYLYMISGMAEVTVDGIKTEAIIGDVLNAERSVQVVNNLTTDIQFTITGIH